MHRAGLAGTGRAAQADEDVPGFNPHPYSKALKPPLSWERRLRQCLRQPGGRVALLSAALLLLGGVGLLLGWRGESAAALRAAGGASSHYQTELDLLIQKAEAERLQLVAELQPIYQHWQGLREEVADKEERRRDAQADFDRVDELMMQRRESVGSMQQPGLTFDRNASETVPDLLKEWDEEEAGVKAALTKAAEQANYAVWREEQAMAQVQDMRDQVLALEAAVHDLKSQNRAGTPPEKLKTGRHFDRKRLVELYAPYIKATAKLQTKKSKTDVRSETQAQVERLTAHLSASVGTFGDWRFERGDPYPPPPPPVEGPEPEDPAHPRPTLSALAENLILGRSPRKELSAAILARFQATAGLRKAEKEAEDEKAAKQDKADAKAAKGGKAVQDMGEEGSHAAAFLADKKAMERGDQGAEDVGPRKDASSGEGGPEDDSVRCRMSGICEDVPGVACSGSGDLLGCIKDTTLRQAEVRKAIQWSWHGYKEYAWGKDELRPVSKGVSTWFNLGLTLVDSLDTLWLAGLQQEYQEAAAWASTVLDPGPDQVVNLFETTIRVLGGLLAAFHLGGGNPHLLCKAVELGLRLSPALHSPSGIPYSDVNLKSLEASSPSWTSYSSLSEVTTLSLEFTYLARASGEGEAGTRTLEVTEQVLHMEGRVDGLAPVWVDPSAGTFGGEVVTLGARGDSYYEYLLKQWILSGKTQDIFLRGYKEAMRGVREKLLRWTRPEAEGGLLYIGELHRGLLDPKMDHLVCFMPGLFALGHLHGVNTSMAGEADDLTVARQLMRTCYEMYRRTATGLAPEIVFFHNSAGTEFPKQHAKDTGGGDFNIKPQDSHNLLRPETVESLFILWRVTGDERYRSWGWHIFRAFQKYTRVSTGGYTCLDSVLSIPPPRRDKMESFWLGETLKYLYLLLDDSSPQLLPLEQYVFNTEAHPLPIQGSPADIAARAHYLLRPPLKASQGGAAGDTKPEGGEGGAGGEVAAPAGSPDARAQLLAKIAGWQLRVVGEAGVLQEQLSRKLRHLLGQMGLLELADALQAAALSHA